MALAQRIAYNVIFNSVAKVISTILALVSIGFMTRYLGAGGFGDYATVLAFFGLFGAIADLGLPTLLAREISRKDAPETNIIGNVLALRIVSSLVVFILALIAVPFLPYPPALRFGIVLAAASFVFSSSSGLLNGIFQKRLAMFQVAIADLLAKCLQLGLVIATVSFNWGFGGIISAFLAYMIFNTGIVFVLSRRFIPFRLSFDLSFWKKFLRASLPVGMISIVSFAYFKADTIILSVLKGSADVGIYNAAYKILENLTFFPAMIAGLILPLFSRYIFHEPEKFRLVADKTFKFFVAFAVPIAVGGFFLAEPLVLLIGGSEFRAAAAPLRILIFSLTAIFFGSFFNAILIAGNLQKRLLVILSGIALFNVSANIIFIPIYSFIGAASVSLLTESAVAVGTAFLASRFLNYRPAREGIPGVLFSALILGAFLFFFSFLSLPILLVGGISVYVFFLWITGSIAADEIEMLFLRNRKGMEEPLAPLVP